jgi:hypothetical protein
VLNPYLPPDDTHRELIMDLIGSWIGNNRKRGEPILLGGDLNAAWMTTDRPTHKLTARDNRTRQWFTTLELKPTYLWLTLQPREYSYETHHSNVTEGTHCSRVDDWLFFSSPDVGISETVFLTKTQVRSEIPHTSDHHPVVLTVDRSQIPIVDTSYDLTATPNVIIWRMKQNVTQDMLSSLRDTLSNEIRKDIESLSHTVTSVHREHHADGEAVIRDISGKVDTQLAKA